MRNERGTLRKVVKRRRKYLHFNKFGSGLFGRWMLNDGVFLVCGSGAFEHGLGKDIATGHGQRRVQRSRESLI